MSSILDALRKAKEADAAPDRAPGDRHRPASVDDVLSTLGYSRHRGVGGVPYGLPLVGVVVLVLVFWWGWREWQFIPTPGETEPPTVAESTAGPTPAPIPRLVRPTPVPSGAAAPPIEELREPAGAESPPIIDTPTAPEPTSSQTPPRQAVGAEPGPGSVPEEPRPEEPGSDPGPESAPDAPDAPVLATLPDVVRPEPVAPAEPDRFALALYHQRTGDADTALRYYQELVERNERAAEVHNNIGLLYRGWGDTARARQAFRRAIALEPRYSKALNNLGASLLDDGSTTEAISQLRAAIDADPDNLDAVVNLALAQRAAGYAEAARATLLAALALDPRNVTGHFNLALVYEEAGDLARAAEHFRAFLDYGSSSHGQLAAEVRARLEILETRLP